MNIFEDDYQRIIEEDNIYYITYKSKELTFEIALKNFENRILYSKGNNSSLICLNISEVKKVSKKARDFLGFSSSHHVIKAIALYSDNILSVFIFKFIAKVNMKKDGTKYKVFQNKKNAIKWLESFK